MATWHKLLEALNIKGGPLMGAWTAVMICLTAARVPIDSGAVTAYLGALGVYGVSKGHALRLEKQVEVKRIQEAGDV